VKKGRINRIQRWHLLPSRDTTILAVIDLVNEARRIVLKDAPIITIE